MTLAEARSRAVSETRYCIVLACAWEGVVKDSVCLERIFTKVRGVEEIRLAWWKNGRQTTRPADLDAIDWVRLFEAAIHAGVFIAEEQLGMLRALLR